MSGLSSTARAAMLQAEDRAAKENGKTTPQVRNHLDRWYPSGTAPKNGTMIKNRHGVTFRWLPYKKKSAAYISGEEGRWQVLRTDNRGNQYWVSATVDDPGEWRGVAKLKAAPSR